MNLLNRMLVQLRKETRPSIYSALCYVEYDKEAGKWLTKVNFWDGKPRSGYMVGVLPEDWQSEYDAASEAVEAVERLFDTLDIIKRPVIIIDDLME